MKELYVDYVIYGIGILYTLFFVMNYVSYKMKLNESEKVDKKKIAAKITAFILVLFSLAVFNSYVFYSDNLTTVKLDGNPEYEPNFEESYLSDKVLDKELLENEKTQSDKIENKESNEDNEENDKSYDDKNEYENKKTKDDKNLMEDEYKEEEKYKEFEKEDEEDEFLDLGKEYDYYPNMINDDLGDIKEDSTVISIAAAGDTTLGYDSRHGYGYSFMHEFERQGEDYSYFFENVRGVFEESDISLVNLEGVLSDDDTDRLDKKFAFLGPSRFSKILSKGEIDAVNLANNHTFDFGERGYQDTKAALDNEAVNYFGNGIVHTKEINGITIKMLGFTGWSGDYYYNRNNIKEEIEKANKEADLVIVSYHWGEEYTYYPNYYQKELGRMSVESGADMVWGHHPHVLQGIEEYEGVNIIYSLGNFSFGGNRNPSDKDSMIYRQYFEFNGGELINTYREVIPISISSVEYRNDFRPVVLDGEKAQRIKVKLKELSEGID